jgi:hypothetical protein
MPSLPPNHIVSLVLTSDQKQQVKAATGRNGEAVELTVEELEERIAPRLASNHNEVLLAD